MKTNKILIVVDMQNDFIDGALGSTMAQAIVQNAANKITSHDGLVVFTRDTHTDDYMNTQEGKYLPVPHCIKDTKGWEIADALKNSAPKNAIIINKPTFGSFELAEALKQYVDSETEIEIIGIATDICVVSNALIIKAAFPENRVIVDSKSCAGITKELHDAALLVMKSCHIDVE